MTFKTKSSSHLLLLLFLFHWLFHCLFHGKVQVKAVTMSRGHTAKEISRISFHLKNYNELHQEFLIILFLWNRISFCQPRARMQWHHYGSLWSQPPDLRQSSHLNFLNSWNYRCIPSWQANVFIGSFVETRPHYTAQAGLNLLGSSKPSTSASQTVEITSVHQHTQP